jgi:hypothetical protein
MHALPDAWLALKLQPQQLILHHLPSSVCLRNGPLLLLHECLHHIHTAAAAAAAASCPMALNKHPRCRQALRSAQLLRRMVARRAWNLVQATAQHTQSWPTPACLSGLC